MGLKKSAQKWRSKFQWGNFTYYKLWVWFTDSKTNSIHRSSSRVSFFSRLTWHRRRTRCCPTQPPAGASRARTGRSRSSVDLSARLHRPQRSSFPTIPTPSYPTPPREVRCGRKRRRFSAEVEEEKRAPTWSVDQRPPVRQQCSHRHHRQQQVCRVTSVPDSAECSRRGGSEGKDRPSYPFTISKLQDWSRFVFFLNTL